MSLHLEDNHPVLPQQSGERKRQRSPPSTQTTPWKCFFPAAAELFQGDLGIFSGCLWITGINLNCATGFKQKINGLLGKKINRCHEIKCEIKSKNVIPTLPL